MKKHEHEQDNSQSPHLSKASNGRPSPDAHRVQQFKANMHNTPKQQHLAQLQATADQHTAQLQKGPSGSGLDSGLASGVEQEFAKETGKNLSLEGTKVVHNSKKPGQMNAHAIAQNKQVDTAPGQKKHTGHELTHILQQKAGMVKPTTKVNGTPVNDDKKLEDQADRIGAKAQKNKGSSPQTATVQPKLQEEAPVQAKEDPTAQREGLSDLKKPVIKPLEGAEIELQKSIMKALSEAVERAGVQAQSVFRLLTIEIMVNSAGEVSLHPMPTVLPVPKGLAPPTALEAMLNTVGGLGGAIQKHVDTILRKSGQMDYLTSSGIMEDWRVLVDVDYYYDRNGQKGAFHKDTIGRSLFVNLNFNNDEEMLGPEYILNPPAIPEHEDRAGRQLPPKFLEDLTNARTEFGAEKEPKAIYNSRIPANGMISFVDELMHHASPYRGHRGVSGEELNDALIAYKLTTLLQNTSGAKVNELAFLQNEIGLKRHQLHYLFTEKAALEVPGGGFTTATLKAILKDNPEYKQMEAMKRNGNLMSFVKNNKDKFKELNFSTHYKKEDLRTLGMSDKAVQELFDFYKKPDMDQVNLADCDLEACAHDLGGVKGPLLKLERQMSGDLSHMVNPEKPGRDLPPAPEEGKRREFFRTWVQVIPKPRVESSAMDIG